MWQFDRSVTEENKVLFFVQQQQKSWYLKVIKYGVSQLFSQSQYWFCKKEVNYRMIKSHKIFPLLKDNKNLRHFWFYAFSSLTRISMPLMSKLNYFFLLRIIFASIFIMTVVVNYNAKKKCIIELFHQRCIRVPWDAKPEHRVCHQNINNF